MKHTFLYLVIVLFSFSVPCKAQQAFEEFRADAGDYSIIYSGQVANTYIKHKYANTPYWETEEYRIGTLSFEGRIYNDVLLRYDAFRKDLNIIPPHNKISVAVDSRKVDYFILNEVRFVPDDKEGYILVLHDSPFLKLTLQLKCKEGPYEVKDNVSFLTFKTQEQYSLTIDGISYDVKKRKSFVKHFPAYKKQLKKYAEENHLNFSKNRRESLTALARYSETLIKANHHEK